MDELRTKEDGSCSHCVKNEVKMWREYGSRMISKLSYEHKHIWFKMYGKDYFKKLMATKVTEVSR